MNGEITLGLSLSTLFAFLLVLARVSGLAAFLPLPVLRTAAPEVRIVLALTVTCALFPLWPSFPNVLPSIAELTALIFAEAGFGLAVGVAMNLLTEGFQLAAQLIGLQAGYGYASTIDPSSQADASVLQVVTMLVTGLLVFLFSFDRELFRILAASFQKFPAGSWQLSVASIDAIVKLGAGMFSLGLRMAMPMTALLLLIDLTLALLGRMQQQLQLLSLAFPIKMLATLILFGVLMPVFMRLFQSAGSKTMETLWRSVGM